jgi:hypothetical protein
MERHFEVPIIVATLRMVPVLLLDGGCCSPDRCKLTE